MDRRSNTFRKKRNCQYVNAGNQRFFVIEVKNRRLKKPRKNFRGALEDGNSGSSIQKSSVHNHNARRRGNIHFSVNEFRRLLAEGLATNTNQYRNKPLDINFADHYQKFKSVISNILGFAETRYVSRAVQAGQNKQRNQPLMMSDIFRGGPKGAANAVPLTIECSTRNNNAFTHETNDNFTCSLPNITLNPCNLSYQNAFFVNHAIHGHGFDSDYEDSSDILSDEDVDDDTASTTNNCAVKSLHTKRNVAVDEAPPLRSVNPNSNEKKQPWQKKQFSEFVNNLLNCISKEKPQNNASINSVHEFEKIFCDGGAASTSKQVDPKGENSQINPQCKPTEQNSLKFLKTHIQGLKQQSPDATPAKTLIEMFGAKSHITKLISNTLDQQQFVTLDPRFRTIRNEADKKVNFEDESQEISKLSENDDKRVIRQEQLTQADECTKSENSSCHSFETAQFQFKTNNPFLCFKGNMISSDVIAVNANTESREMLFTMHEHVAHIETHLIYLQDYLSDVKRDMLAHYKILEEQRDIVNQRNGDNNLEDAKVYPINCDKLCRTFSSLECTAGGNASHIEKIKKMSLRVNTKFIASVAFFVGFMCGDFVRK